MSEGTWEKLAQITVKGAEHDSRERLPHPQCLEGTRVVLLNHIYGKLDDKSKSQLIWLHGTAGVGKSAVAFTVAERMRGLKVMEETNVEKRLAGTFFFSRKHTNRRTTGYFFATLAYQLATNFPSVKTHVNKAILENPALLHPDGSLRKQMEELFSRPLRQLKSRLRECPPLAFVIDALDECTEFLNQSSPESPNQSTFENKSETELAELISLLAQALHDPNLPVTHILVTSRSEAHIQEAMQNEDVCPLVCEIPVKISGQGVAATISLDGADVDEDIYLFLEHSFTRLRSRFSTFPQPTKGQLERLANRAGRRFIVASTMMKFIDDRHNDPHDRLELMLELTSELLPGTEVYKLYDRILSTCADPTQAYLHLSVVAALADPLPMAQISELLGPGQGRDVEAILVQLRSVIDVPTDSSLPVKISHSSVRDYVSHRSNCSLPQVEYITSPDSLLALSSLHLIVRKIPKRTALLDALSELNIQSQSMEVQDPRNLTHSLFFMVQPPEPVQVLITLLWLRGHRNSELHFWLETLDGRAWLETVGAKDWLLTQGGKDWLLTDDGNEWLRTQAGRDWLQTEGGKDWLWTLAGRAWLQTEGGRDWLSAEGGSVWLQTRRGWLRTLAGHHWLQTEGGRGSWLLTQGGSDWLRTLDGHYWLQCQGGSGWLRTLAGHHWLQCQGGQAHLPTQGPEDWLQTQSGQDWLKGRDGAYWLQTRSGRHWLRTKRGIDWLQTEGGRDWLQTEGGRDWLQEESGRCWLQAESGRGWLQTQGGRDWLQTQSGRDWLEEFGGRDWLQIEDGQQWLDAPGGRVWLLTQAGQQWLEAPGGRVWLHTQAGQCWLQNTDVQKWLQTQSGEELERLGGVDWLQTEGGEKWLLTPAGEDWLLTQAGEDWLQTEGGQYWLRTQVGEDGLLTQAGEDWLQIEGRKYGLRNLGDEPVSETSDTPSLSPPQQCTSFQQYSPPLSPQQCSPPLVSRVDLVKTWDDYWLQIHGVRDLQTLDGQDWLQTQVGRHWLQTQGGKTWLQTQGGRDWLQTLGGRDWLQTRSGESWLPAKSGQGWLQTEGGREWLQTEGGREWLQTQRGREWLQTEGGREWLDIEGGQDWLQTPHGQAWRLTTTWVTMEEFSSTLQAVREYIIVPELPLQPAFQVIQQFESLPDYLMFPAFLALRHHGHSTAPLAQRRLPPDMEIIHAVEAFLNFAHEARAQSQSTSDALNYACQNWAVHLSRAPNPWDERLTHTFKSFWNRNLLSWLERQWCLKDLRSCLIILSEGEKLAKQHLQQTSGSSQ